VPTSFVLFAGLHRNHKSLADLLAQGAKAKKGAPGGKGAKGGGGAKKAADEGEEMGAGKKV
jgi:hypothetical protein